MYSGSTGGIVLHILFLAIWTANVFALWKNGPAKASPLGAALGVFFLVWGVGGRGAVWLGLSLIHISTATAATPLIPAATTVWLI